MDKYKIKTRLRLIYWSVFILSAITLVGGEYRNIFTSIIFLMITFSFMHLISSRVKIYERFLIYDELFKKERVDFENIKYLHMKKNHSFLSKITKFMKFDLEIGTNDAKTITIKQIRTFHNAEDILKALEKNTGHMIEKAKPEQNRPKK